MDRRLLADTRPLANPHFKRLWRANIVTVVGAQLTVVAVPAQIYAMTGSSAYVGLTGIFGLVPLVVFGLWGGALADVFDRRTLLLITTCGLIATSAGFWLQAALGAEDVWLLLSLFAVQQAFFAVNQPTRSALLPRLLDEELLPAANSLNMTVMQAGGIAGPLVGGALIPLIGFSWLYLLDTVTLFATLGAVVRPPAAADPGRHRDAGDRGGDRRLPLPAYAAGADDVVRRRHHRHGLRHAAGAVPRARRRRTSAGPTRAALAFALLFAAIPAGAVMGGVLSGWVSRVERQGLAVIVAILVWGLAMVGFGVAAMLAPRRPGRCSSAIAVLMLAIGGAADMASAAFRTSMLQAAADDSVRGRLQGIFIVVVAGGPRVADVLHGATAAVTGAAVAAAGGGVLVIIGTVLAALAVPAFVRYRVTRVAV